MTVCSQWWFRYIQLSMAIKLNGTMVTNATGTGSTTATFTLHSHLAGTTYYRVLINAGK
jgi:hypothetical protein